MDKEILKQIKTKLLAERDRLGQELAGFAKRDNKVKDNYQSNFPKFGDSEEENAAEVAAYSDQLSIEHTLEEQLRDVSKALQSIEKGNYGICKYCGKPIEEKRLLIRPVSSSCVECKKKLKGEA